jgi:hypothetical protein
MVMKRITEYSGNLERMLKKDKLFLLDTSVLLGGESGIYNQESELECLSSEFNQKKHRKDFLKSACETITRHQNIRLTYEVYKESLSKLGQIVSEKNKKQFKFAQTMEGYLRNHKKILLNGGVETRGWRNSVFLDSGRILDEKFKIEHPELKPLSEADISLLLASLEMLLEDDENYEKIDLITCDYGILKGAEVMFKNLDYLELDNIRGISPKSIRKAKHRCTNVILRAVGKEYDYIFNSVDFCNKLESQLVLV